MSSAAGETINFIQFSPGTYCSQSKSPLFSIIPAEVRDRIFYYALADYEDATNLYDHETCYRRPDYLAPRRSDTALLRTCQRVYQEAWFRPWTSAEHTLWLTAGDRRPGRVTTIEKLQDSLDLLHKHHGDTEVDHLRVFSQLYMLENGHRLGQILTLQHFHPRGMTVTIRHTDTWFWESDEPLRIASQWVKDCRFPDSLRELRVELESLERKKGQVDYMAAQMVEKWQFLRRDNSVLSAQGTRVGIMRWSGSSTWGGERWIRDETRPETLEYYVATVTWRISSGPDAARTRIAPVDLAVPAGTGKLMTVGSISVAALKNARVPPGASASRVEALVSSWRGLRRRLGRDRHSGGSRMMLPDSLDAELQDEHVGEDEDGDLNN